LDEVIVANLKTLFPGMDVLEAHPFRVTRNADMVIQELKRTICWLHREECAAAAFRHCRAPDGESACRLQCQILMSNLEVGPQDVYSFEGPLAINRLMSLYAINRHDLKAPSFLPVIPSTLDARFEQSELFSNIRREPILLHHPFDSFKPVVDFLRAAAVDPDVLAIKMTLYRMSYSPVSRRAKPGERQTGSRGGIEARFDEERATSIGQSWARRRACGLWACGSEDACKIARGSSEGSSMPLRPHVHRQPQPGYRTALRIGLLHQRRGHRRTPPTCSAIFWAIRPRSVIEITRNRLIARPAGGVDSGNRSPKQGRRTPDSR
jgi:hypothetical protein